jgi:hypothetical protein
VRESQSGAAPAAWFRNRNLCCTATSTKSRGHIPQAPCARAAIEPPPFISHSPPEPPVDSPFTGALVERDFSSLVLMIPSCLDPSLCGRSANSRWAQLHARLAAADDTTKSNPSEWRVALAACGELCERCCRPSVAVLAVEAQRVVASEKVGDGVEADRSVHR